MLSEKRNLYVHYDFKNKIYIYIFFFIERDINRKILEKIQQRAISGCRDYGQFGLHFAFYPSPPTPHFLQ